MSAMDMRGMKRDSLFLMADITISEDRPTHRVKVRNLSALGMMIEGQLVLAPGMRVVVGLRNLDPFAGIVVWTDGNRAGISFECVIDPQVPRTQVFGGPREAPVYARSVLTPAINDGWNGKIRRI